MKGMKFLFVLLFCFSGATYASMFTTVGDVTASIAFDRNDTVVAITKGSDWSAHPTYALHYSKDFGKTWQHVVDGDELCVKWHSDSQRNTKSSFDAIRYLDNKFYAVGSDRRVCSSANGIDGWVVDTAWSGGYPTDTLADIAFGKLADGTSKWAVVGNNGSIYSRDAKSGWTAHFEQNAAMDYKRIAFGHPTYGPTFVANTGKNLWFSHNGDHWEEVSPDEFKNIEFFSVFSNLYYEQDQNKFVLLNIALDGDQLVPVAISSENGKNWQIGKGFTEDAHSFEDITYAADQKSFITIGVHGKVDSNGELQLKGDTEKSPDAKTWTTVDKTGPIMYSVIYSDKTKQLTATSMRPTSLYPAPDGIVTRTLTSEWVPAELDNSGKCAGQNNPFGLLSKPIIITDKSGREHYIATPQYPAGCAYWANSDNPNKWTASDYLWN